MYHLAMEHPGLALAPYPPTSASWFPRFRSPGCLARFYYVTPRQSRASTQLVSPSYSPASGREGFLRAIIPEWDFTIDQKTVRKNNLLWKISSCGWCGILKIGADYSVARFKRKQLRIICHRSRHLRSGILGRMPLDFLFLPRVVSITMLTLVFTNSVRSWIKPKERKLTYSKTTSPLPNQMVW